MNVLKNLSKTIVQEATDKKNKNPIINLTTRSALLNSVNIEEDEICSIFWFSLYFEIKLTRHC